MSQPNPYSSPEAPFTPAAKTASSNQIYVQPFQPLLTVGNCVAVLLGMVAFAKFAAVIATVNIIMRAWDGAELGSTEIASAALILGLVVIGATFLSVIAGIVYLVWLHRAYSNLPALGVKRLDASPGWAVAHYFIPILNLFRPYQTMVEVWNCSVPLEDNRLGRTSSAIVGWWWAGWIISTLLGQVSGAMVRADEIATDMFVTAAWVDVAMHAISLATAVLAIVMIRRISHNQQRRFQSGAVAWGEPAAATDANPFAPPVGPTTPAPSNPFAEAPSANPFAPGGR